MKNLADVVRKVEVVTGIPRIDIEVFFKTEDGCGWNLSFARRRDDLKYDLYSLKKEVSLDAWKTTEGVKEAYRLNSDKDPIHSIGDDFDEIINDIISAQGLTQDEIEVIHFEIKEDGVIQLVLEPKK